VKFLLILAIVASSHGALAAQSALGNSRPLPPPTLPTQPVDNPALIADPSKYRQLQIEHGDMSFQAESLIFPPAPSKK
jgi:hypothetical protein